jgi:hypothetical protein
MSTETIRTIAECSDVPHRPTPSAQLVQVLEIIKREVAYQRSYN